MAKIAWLPLLCMILLAPALARAQTYALSPEPSADVLTITFAKKAPPPMVLRTGSRRVEVLFPQGTKLGPLPKALAKGRHIQGLSIADNVLAVDMGDESFGFVSSPAGDRAVKLQVYYDPAGARWNPPAPGPGQAPSPQAKGPGQGAGQEQGQAKPESGAAPAPSPPPPAKSSFVRGDLSPSGQDKAQPQAADSKPAAEAPAPPAVDKSPVGSVPAKPGPEPAAKPVTQAIKAGIQPNQAPPQPSPQPSPAPAPVKPAGQVPDSPKAAASPVTPPAPADKPEQPAQTKAEIKPDEQIKPESPPKTEPQAGPEPQAAPEKASAEPTPEQGGQGEEDKAHGPKEASAVIDARNLLVNGEQARLKGEADKAMSVARGVLNAKDMPNDVREEALYLLANAMFDQDRDKLAEEYDHVNDAYQQALNFNTASDKVPQALSQLGYINLFQGYLPEAKAYFNLLKSRYPNDERVPLTDLYYGQYYQGLGLAGKGKINFETAVESFKALIQNYPESKNKMDAALGLARCYLELQRYNDADTIIDFIEKIQPRFYVDNPYLRRISADVSYKLGRFEKARDDYLWYYNLAPGDETADLVLARLGDVEARLGKPDAARNYYETAIRLHPGKEGALMAMMRLAEQGIHDSPTIQEMFKTFAAPKDVKPDQIYDLIVKDYPKSDLAPLALLKLAIWRLYKQDNMAALEAVNQFLTTYPDQDKDLVKQVREVGAQAFDKELTPLMAEMNYKRINELWRANSFLADQQDLLPSRDRLAVALALYYAGSPRDALTMAEPYLKAGQSDDAQKAAALCLTIYRENQDWQSILNTVSTTGNWKMDDNPRRAMEFAQAMALEHTGDLAKSRLLWAKLAADNQLEPAKRAYAVYYQALTAMDRSDYGQALFYAMDAQNLFMEAAKDTGKAQDSMLLVIKANQKLGRYPEALHWCEEYAKTVTQGSDEWGANLYRMATLYRLMGNGDSWRKSLESVRDTMGGSLYGNMATAELTGRRLEDRAGQIAGPP